MILKIIKQFVHSFYTAIVDTIEHDGIEHAGYLAFLLLLSLFPFLFFLMALLGQFGQTEIGINLLELLRTNLPANAVRGLELRISEIISGPPQSLLTVAILGAIWTASSSVEGLRTILNRAYRVGTPPHYVLRRLLSIIQFLVITGAIILALLLLLFLPILWQHVEPYLTIDEVFHPKLNYVRYFLGISLLFLAVCALYFMLPNIKQSWHAVFPGAVLVMLGWFGAGWLFKLYLDYSEQVNLIYGSLAGIIVFLLFFYIIDMVFIFGAEFNYQVSKAKGEHLEQKEDVIEEE